MRMGRDGMWLFGADNIEVEKGSQWAANPLSLKHGWINWKKVPQGSKEKPEKFGEILVAMHEPKPLLSSLPVYENGEWLEQTSITFRCLTGEDEGTQSDYKPSSVGGANAMKDLIAAIMKQLDEDPEFPVPLIEFGSSSYQHKTYGKTYTPELKIVDWLSLEDAQSGGEDDVEDEADAPQQTQAAAPAAPAEGRRRRAAEPAPAPAAQADEDGDGDNADGAPATDAPAQGTEQVRRRRR